MSKSVEVLPDEKTLARCASVIRRHLDRMDQLLWNANEERLAIGRELMGARQQFATNRAFGEWCDAQNFGMDRRRLWECRRIAEHQASFRTALSAQADNGTEENWKTAAKVAVKVDQLAEDDPDAHVCLVCGEVFDEPVWHCPRCVEHWPKTHHKCDACAERGGLIELDHLGEVVTVYEEPEKAPPITKPKLNDDGVSHPARFSDPLFPHFVELLDGYPRVLDPFAGTGRIHELVAYGFDTVGIELEAEWANLHERTQVGDATDLPFDDETFDAVCTSPTYGNRLADHHKASDPESRRSYTHDLGRKLSANNTGAMHWRGPDEGDYCAVHDAAWCEAVRVLRPGGRFVLNIKDHTRDGAHQDVMLWHFLTLQSLGLVPVSFRSVATSSLRAGENADAREPVEYVIAFDKD